MWWFGFAQVTTIEADTIINGDVVIKNGERYVLKDGAALTVDGDLVLDGSVSCSQGSVNLTVTGDLTLTGSVSCDRGDEVLEGDTGRGISIAVGGVFVMDSDAEISSNGHVQIVENPNLLAKTAEDFATMFEGIARDNGAGVRVGPFVDEGVL